MRTLSRMPAGSLWNVQPSTVMRNVGGGLLETCRSARINAPASRSLRVIHRISADVGLAFENQRLADLALIPLPVDLRHVIRLPTGRAGHEHRVELMLV